MGDLEKLLLMKKEAKKRDKERGKERERERERERGTKQITVIGRHCQISIMLVDISEFNFFLSKQPDLQINFVMKLSL